MTDPQQPPHQPDPGRGQEYGAGPSPFPQQADGGPAPTKRPGAVVAGCSMAWLGGALGVMIGLALLSVQADDETFDKVDNADDVVAQLHIIGPVLAAWCLAVIVVAVFAFLGRKWAALTLMVMAVVSLVLCLVSVFSGGGIGILPGVYGVLSAFLVHRSRRSKDWFAAMQRSGDRAAVVSGSGTTAG